MGWWIVILGFVSAGFSAYLADVKNRNAATWLILGFIFGIFALITIAGLPPGDLEPTKPDGEAKASGAAKPWNPLAGPPE
jgi:hypothetical protein